MTSQSSSKPGIAQAMIEFIHTCETGTSAKGRNHGKKFS
jgi:hypothetical protein